MNNSITIIGGGIVGLTLAAILAKNNFSVSIIESKTPKLNWEKDDLTGRVSAVHLTSAKLFQYLDLPKLLNQSAPLYSMLIWDHTQNAHLHFDSRDVNEKQMGFIIENRAMVKALWEKLMRDERVKIFCPQTPDTSLLEKNNLIIGADGAHSWVRKQMPITMQERSYQQKAIIAVIESEHAHHHCAYQKFLTTGPVALLPLVNSHHTALVWSADNAISDALMQKSDDVFSRELTTALDYKLGKLKCISARAQFPLTMRHAKEYASENFALVGDAAHTIHPLAGLGVNLGLMDAACLAQVLIDARENKKRLGDLRTLRRYTRWRKSENAPVIGAMRGLKKIFAINENTFNSMRSFGINTIDQCTPIKNQLMKIAMGQSDELPAFLQNDHFAVC